MDIHVRAADLTVVPGPNGEIELVEKTEKSAYAYADSPPSYISLYGDRPAFRQLIFEMMRVLYGDTEAVSAEAQAVEEAVRSTAHVYR